MFLSTIIAILLATVNYNGVHSFQNIRIAQRPNLPVLLAARHQPQTIPAADADDKKDLHFDRRQMLAVLGAWSLIAPPSWAVDEDLAMPTPEEQVQKPTHLKVVCVVSTPGYISSVHLLSSFLAMNVSSIPVHSHLDLQDEAAIMEERLRRKAELQKKMASPKTFNQSLKNEFSKQSDMNKKSKEERRNAMCEELGRGC